MEQTAQNPFLQEYHTPFATIPFDQIKNEDYEPAFEEGIQALKAEIDAIASNPEPPTFENTLVALERSGKLLTKVSSAFFNLLSANTNDEMMEISQRISPALTESSNYIYLNESLFARVKAVYEQRDALHLDTEDAKLLQETYRSFEERGATLDASGKEQYRKISTELSLLSLQFDQNSLKDKQRFELHITDEKELSGLPDSIREAAAHLAREKQKTGWLFTLDAPSYIPFLRYADSRELREKMYRAYQSISCKGDQYDNQEIVRKLVNNRLALAKLMGYPTYAAFELAHKMAKTTEHVYDLLNRLLEAYKPVAQQEYQAVCQFAKGKDNLEEIKPWDWSYYSEQIKSAKFQVNDEMTRPYFRLEQVKQGVFGLATQLYGITFKENPAIPVYHPEVQAYEVYDADGRFLAILYTDFYPREGKQSGAWMNSLKSQWQEADGTDSRPHVIIVMNFTRPTDKKPALLTYDEVETLLHEFGHALHGMFAAGKYASLSGTNVYQDFVELPSQLMENWLRQQAFLDQIAMHYETGEKIPAELVQKLIDAANFNVGYACCRQVSFGLLDMAWHTITTSFEKQVIPFEKEAWKKAVVVPEIPEACMSTNFGHLFAGGYAAGYYGYKWAEVLDADAFSLFLEKGIFNQEVAHSFRENILSKGGTEDPDILYRRFRGQDPTIDALLRRNGIQK